MWSWLAGLIEAVLKALLAPKNASATSEAERAGAAEAAVSAHEQAIGQVGAADAARDRADAAVPDATGGLPDDGWRRD